MMPAFLSGRSLMREILQLLQDGEFHSGESIGALLGVSRAAVWKQLQHLEAAGRASRLANPSDARSMLVQLTPAGLELIDHAVTAHVQNQARIVAPLAEVQRAELEARLTDLLAVLEPAAE